MRGELIEGPRVHSIVGAFFEVHNYFGFGLAEAIYCGALQRELRLRGHSVAHELSVPVAYKGERVAHQRLDLVVDGKIVVELKATEKLSAAAAPQLISYLRATPFTVGVLLHFGRTATFERFVDYPKRQRSVP